MKLKVIQIQMSKIKSQKKKNILTQMQYKAKNIIPKPNLKIMLVNLIVILLLVK